MHYSEEFYILDFIIGLSETVDLISPIVSNHHRRVTYIAYSIAIELEVTRNDLCDIIMAAMLHDIGAITVEDRMEKLQFESNSQHAFAGYLLTEAFAPIRQSAKIIRFHHTDDRKNEDIPLGSCIIHLADAVAILIDDTKEILAQKEKIVEAVVDAAKFHPSVRAAFRNVAQKEVFWFETLYSDISRLVLSENMCSEKIKGLDVLLSFSKVMARIIDFRSRFTATHSSGTAAVAAAICRLLDFSEKECLQMEIAGYLHDIGKLSVPAEILEKNTSLSLDEVKVIHAHAYHTYRILSHIRGLEQITVFAAYHHEQLDGMGYPFHVKSADLSKLCRIMPVADIFTAITEDRPYRSGLSADKAMQILTQLGESGAIDSTIVKVVRDNFALINQMRITAQRQSQQDYEHFIRRLNDIG